TNDITRLQALVDRKKLVITEAAIRDLLRLDDVEGSMSAKCTSWNEFSSAMASAVIACPQEGGKGFSGVETPLFKGMLVERVIEEEGDAEEQVQDVVDDAAQGADTARIDTLEDTVMADASNQGRMIDVLDKDDVVALMDDKEEEKKEEEVKDDQVQGRQAEIYKIDMDHASKVLSIQEDEPTEVQEVVDVVTTVKLITEVVTDANEIVTAASTTISAAEPQVLAAATTTAASCCCFYQKKKRSEPKPLKKKQQVEIDEEYTRKLHEELNKDIDWDVAIEHVKQKAKEDPAVKRYQAMKRKPLTKAQARRNMIMYLKNVAGFRLDYFKGVSYDDIFLIFEVKFNSNVDFILKTKEQMEEEERRSIQSIKETPAQKAAKRRKLNEEVEDLKRHLEIVLDEDDDV
nr:hypothetical protein [Tanacetum cinerariifolium]